jgi:hypothetical protein
MMHANYWKRLTKKAEPRPTHDMKKPTTLADNGQAPTGVALQRLVRPHAVYRCMVGSKLQNQLISHAGLGITGAFEPIQYVVGWKPDEVVDDDRAQKICEVLKRGLNETGDMECNSVELLRVYVA